MSTVLINTSGVSTFEGSTSFVDFGQKDQDDLLKKLGISSNNTDNKPVLKPYTKVIDVVNDFSWYAGPKATPTALNRIPCCFITEREQLLSSLISGGMYYLNAAGKTAEALAGSDWVTSLLGAANEGGKEEGGKSNPLLNKIKLVSEAIESLAGSTEDRLLLDQHNLKSLEGIYFTKETDFHYRLPIYGSNDMSLSEGFGTDASGQLGQALGSKADEAINTADSMAMAVNFAQPGVYIEKPNYFQGVTQGRTEVIEFPLSNTVRRGTVSPIQQNYELLWLLAFQNKPYKTSFTRTPPPKIYTVSVPGQFSMPYAYISGMSVDFVGTLRKAVVTVPSGNGEGTIGSKEITTTVPEAYQVKLNFTSLIGEYGNTMLSDTFSTSVEGNRVSIGDAPKAEVVGPPLATR